MRFGALQVFHSEHAHVINLHEMAEKSVQAQRDRLDVCAARISVQIPAETQINSEGQMRCHKEFIIPSLK